MVFLKFPGDLLVIFLELVRDFLVVIIRILISPYDFFPNWFNIFLWSFSWLEISCDLSTVYGFLRGSFNCLKFPCDILWFGWRKCWGFIHKCGFLQLVRDLFMIFFRLFGDYLLYSSTFWVLPLFFLPLFILKYLSGFLQVNWRFSYRLFQSLWTNCSSLNFLVSLEVSWSSMKVSFWSSWS